MVTYKRQLHCKIFYHILGMPRGSKRFSLTFYITNHIDNTTNIEPPTLRLPLIFYSAPEQAQCRTCTTNPSPSQVVINLEVVILMYMVIFMWLVI